MDLAEPSAPRRVTGLAAWAALIVDAFALFSAPMVVVAAPLSSGDHRRVLAVLAYLNS